MGGCGAICDLLQQHGLADAACSDEQQGSRGAGIEGGDGDRFVGRLEDVVSAGEHRWHLAEADAIRACAAPAAFTACLYHAVLPARCDAQRRP
jgi:hypothetical protein